MNNKAIDKLREVCGTLPNRQPEKSTKIVFGCDKLEVEIVDMPSNMYKAIFAMATATWGDEKYERKWDKLDPYHRYLVVLNALNGKTLPTAIEAPKFTFIVRGTPRHCFDQMARTRLGSGFGSIGCRDNSKLDSSFILYSEYFYSMWPGILDDVKLLLYKIKDIYESIILNGEQSWQIARSVLPMCYHHPFVFTQTLLALLSQCRRRMCFGEEEFICGIHWYIREVFRKMGLNLIANIMRPGCDYAHNCLYSKSDGSELFSNLFAGCGRWKPGSEYAEWNKSCTDKERLESQIGTVIPRPTGYINFTPDRKGFGKVGKMDLELLSEK